MICGCVYEPKWDGFRLAILRDFEVSLWSLQGKNLTEAIVFPNTCRSAS